MLSPANLAVKVYFPFLVSFTFTVATPLALVFAVYVFRLTLKVIFLFLIALPLADLNVAVSFLVLAFALYVFLAVVSLAVCLITVTLAVSNLPAQELSPRNVTATEYDPAFAILSCTLAVPFSSVVKSYTLLSKVI